MIPVAIKRLYRRCRWLLVSQWRTLSIKRWPYESCDLCGKAFRLVWSVDDKYWTEIVDPKGGGCLCLDCFLERANGMGLIVPDVAIRIEPFQPERV